MLTFDEQNNLKLWDIKTLKVLQTVNKFIRRSFRMQILQLTHHQFALIGYKIHIF